MTDPARLQLVVNGRAHEMDVPPETLLLDLLRERLDLKGAKRSCDAQVCGACTVLVDGLAVSACTYLAVEADGRTVTTVEGLAGDGRRHPIQEAFLACGAVQCGFCTSGMLLTTMALLDEHPAAEDVFHHLRGSLCRCTGYRKIVDAILAAGRVGEGPAAPSRTIEPPAADDPARARPLRVVGRSVPRVDGDEKITGRARYVTDLTVTGMAHAKVLRSPYPHARLLRVDAARARARPGVLAVLTGAALTWCDPYYGPAFRDRPVLAIDVARHEGEPVAAVVAVDEATAAEALELIDVDYAPLPAVITLEEALAPGAPLVHTGQSLAGHFADLSTLRPEPGTNVCHRFRYARGHVEDALARAALVLEETFHFPRVQHYAMEPHAALAAWDETGGLTVWASTQNPYSVRVELARMFGLPLSRIRIVVPHLGGGFGSKTYAKLEPLAAALARVAGRPVRLAASAAEAFQTVRRCSSAVTVRVGFARDGTLLAVDCRADFDVGAYADIGPRVVQKATYTATGPYRVAHVALDARAVYTNTTPGGAFRGFGVPQLAWALESLVDVAADRLGRDPVDLRRQNLLAHGEEFAPGDTPIDGKLEESLGRAAEAIRWTDTPPAGRGRGVAAMLKASIAPSVSVAIVRLHADASVTVLASTVEMGQGARTALAQIAAEALAVPLAQVTVAAPDTAITPYDQTTSSSRSTVMTGRAVLEAAQEVRHQLLRVVADHLGVAAQSLGLEDGAVVAGERRLAYSEILALRFGMSGGELIGRGVVAPGRTSAPLGGSTPFWEMAVGAAEVSLDEETGALRVERYVSVADVGRAINPLVLEGQDEGAVVQGLGHTLLEEMVYEEGHLLNGTLLLYRVPRADDGPAALECRFVENADGSGPFGAKGAGEGSLIPVSPAVANALARLTGIRLRELPLTPERVWRALRARRP
ncbi:MAG: molybdopterin-dependent oxidoreductase [Candidatus Rokubacteria bacterium]|nr:molybdopterin-dependent oxidoreductase [Candidatus Rokubacteria bacterium]